nr:MAG TPA: helix-turn-helix domain protein [Caudoviricetes sp.]
MENNLAALRKTAGLTQKQLANLVDINISQIQRAESGESRLSNFTAINLLRIAAVLGVDPYDLIGLSRDEIPRA